MLIGRRLNDYQTAVDARGACWDKNTWAVLASLVIIAPMFLPLSGVLYFVSIGAMNARSGQVYHGDR